MKDFKKFGNVVKVDQLTIAQARGKLSRVCVEVDIRKSLKPFVEVESEVFGLFTRDFHDLLQQRLLWPCQGYIYVHLCP